MSNTNPNYVVGKINFGPSAPHLRDLVVLPAPFGPKVVCGFPGVGKSHCARTYGFLDSDSSNFSWLPSGERNPDFPRNYVENLYKNLHRSVLASTHLEVRNELVKQAVPFVLVYPHRNCKEEYIERYRHRGSPQKFIDLLNNNWETWILEMEVEFRARRKYVLNEGEYLSDIIYLLDGAHKKS